jgi:hypothetical protein
VRITIQCGERARHLDHPVVGMSARCGGSICGVCGRWLSNVTLIGMTIMKS